MRINKYLALSTGLSRRMVDGLIKDGKIIVNNLPAKIGQEVSQTDIVKLNNKIIHPKNLLTIIINKPSGIVCSRNGQGAKTIYDLLPNEYHNLKSIGRLDKESTGLLLLTNDGELANQLTHPKFAKSKKYLVSVSPELTASDKLKIKTGIELNDGLSSLSLTKFGSGWIVTMKEGRNRQIRRTFNALSYNVIRLHRTDFGNYKLGNLKTGEYKEIN